MTGLWRGIVVGLVFSALLVGLSVALALTLRP